MSRTVAVAVILGLALVWIAVGATVLRIAERAPDAVATGVELEQKPRPTTFVQMPFADWGEPPALVILFSGQQRGRLKPCGCSPAFQKGGLSKRAAFVRYVRETKKWPVVALDLGGLVDDPDQAYGLHQYIAGPEHRLAKLEVTLLALQSMGYDVIGVGPEDVALENGAFTYVTALRDVERPTATNCNLSIPQDLQETVPPYCVVERAGVRIGVTAVVGKTKARKVRDSITPLVWVAPLEAISAVLPALEGCDLKVLLFYGARDEARQFVESCPEFDLIIHGDEEDEPDGKEVWVGDTLLVTVGKKGKYAGAVGYWPNRAKRFSFELVDLDDRFADDPEVAKYVQKIYVQKLAGLQLVQRLVKKNLPDGASIAGVEACRSCHPRVVAKWEASRHAHGLESLKKTGEHVNPECLACHTTMFGYRGGYDGTPATAHLGGNQCENCHGPAGQHVRDPENPVFRAMLHRESVSVEMQLCRRCHDAENDPKFEFQKRWREVVHTQEARQDALEYRRKAGRRD